MSSARTRNLLLHYLVRGGHLNEDDYAVLGRDRDIIDQAIWKALSQRPGDVNAAAVDLATRPSLDLDTSSGSLDAGQRYFYVYTLVDAFGIESLPSPENFVTIPAEIAEPSAPTAAAATTGGTLLAGTHYYAVSAYKGSSSLETTAPNWQRVQLGSSNTSKVTLTLPSLPAGADGFNIYRRRPGTDDFRLIGTVDMVLSPFTTTFVDTGLADDPVKGLPKANNTSSQAQVEVSVPGATPDVPDGYTWKIYRSTTSGVYVNALVHHVVEETSEGSGIITPTYMDIGLSTELGSPPDTQINYPSNPKVDLNDANEVSGVLPPANEIFLGEKSFVYPGTMTDVLTGTFVWTFPFQVGLLRYVIISIGYGGSPSFDEIVVDVEKADPNTDDFATIYSVATKPTIAIGGFSSPAAVPDTRPLVQFARLKVDLTQIDSGATPTGADLLVTFVYYYWDNTATTVAKP